ncbi:MAG TPA: carbohydrate-binding protein [Gammaproteobacteria bacterium]
MRKRIINLDQKQNVGSDQKWLDIEKLAVVEVTSEDDAFPIEFALLPGKASGWRASGPGKQMVRLVFDNPQRLQWIRLNFEELEMERTQEYVLRWSPDDGQSYQEIIRQQWNFSPEGATSEIEDYQVELPAVTILELIITPDISERTAFASLKNLQLA